MVGWFFPNENAPSRFCVGKNSRAERFFLVWQSTFPKVVIFDFEKSSQAHKIMHLKTPLLFLAMAFLPLLPCQSLQAASRQVESVTSEIRASQRPPHFQKQKKKWRFGQWMKSKFVETSDKPRRENHFGRLGLWFLLGGIAAGAIFPLFLFLGVPTGIVFGIIGLFKDQDKTFAIVTVILPIFLAGVAIALTHIIPSE